ncbi:Retron-type RNA-directed DNA polymerase [Geobacillus proteiniphilus]|uniref:Retron-type RNA-directed DNA polymerase n=1 Tax=Geobacillus proteiniphilus TaxID=860353 RepID=A0A1Q5STW8_9BACL|nr:reverse transcriptase/maturase family protein [Geobacillus proteiniphilus]OKO91410.1 Retron-type RNA-directed DNA polymerase [Geobacillus proteiniphilus]
MNTEAENGKELFRLVYDFNNLYEAYMKSRCGKRWKGATNRFEMNALEYVAYLQHLLKTKTYTLGAYNVFKVYEPKERIIKSIPFKDKVVQRSLCDNVLEPIFERSLIYDSYACRKGKGVHAGLKRTAEFFRRHYRKYGLDGWVLKCDIEKYFDSIDHDILKKIIRKYIADENVLWLLDMIIDSTDNPGLPIGNQTSQWFANLFLNSFDHFIKEKLKIKMYIRYMDDFILIHPDKEYLRYCKQEIVKYLDTLKLKLNRKSHIFPLRNGVDFLGFHTYLTETGKVIRKIRRDSKKRIKRKLKKFKELYASGERTKEQIERAYKSWVAHASHGNCYHLIQNMNKRYQAIFEGDERNASTVE